MKTEFAKAELIITHANELSNDQDILSKIHQEELQGIIIREIFSKAEMQQLRQQIELEETGFFPTRYGKTYGLSLSEIEGDKSNYLQTADKFRKMLSQALSNDYEKTIINVFSQISGDRNILSPEENNKPYTPATVRFVPPNQPGIIAHIDSEFTYSPNYSYLHQIADIPNCFSYFIVVKKPDRGGELILHELCFDSEELKMMETGRNQFIVSAKENLDNYSNKHYQLEEGDIVIFKSSVILHEIGYISGDTTRMTIGGFLALSLDNKQVYYWS